MKARLLITKECNRKCEGCCNLQEDYQQPEVLKSIDQLLLYDEVIITGGEPLFTPYKTLDFIAELRLKNGYTGRVYLYSAFYNKALASIYKELFKYIDGLHFTIHQEASDKEIIELRDLSELLFSYPNLSFRLSIDERLFDRYDFSNIKLSVWSVIRKMQWLQHCKLPENEQLFIMPDSR